MNSPPRVPEALPRELGAAGLARRIGLGALLFAVIALLIATVPGIGEVRERFADARPGWLVAMVVLELCSCLSYVVAFKGVFCARLEWRFSYEVGMAEQGTNVLVPAGGIGGLALGAWVLRQGGMAEQGTNVLVPAGGIGGLALGAWVLRQGGMASDRIARRSVAFFLITSIPNFFCAAVLGILIGSGAVPSAGPRLVAAILGGLALAVVIVVVVLPRALRRIGPDHSGSLHEDDLRARVRRLARRAAGAVAGGVGDTGMLLRSRQPYALLGSIGYMGFDLAALAASFEAFGVDPSLAGFAFAYVIGQLGGLLPLPGGIGGIEGGLIGALALYGSPLALATAAVLAYRVVQLGMPAILGSVAFLQLRRRLSRDEAPAALCEPIPGGLPVFKVPAR